jgi:homocysteine S-methyltransferase
MANEVPGVKMPEAIVERMRRAEANGRAADEGLLIAREIAADVRPLVQGVQISTAPRAIDMALGLIDISGAIGA